MDNVMRKESVLILPINTFKFIDFAIQMKLNQIMENNEPADRVLEHITARTIKSLAEFNKVEEDVLNTFVKNNLVELYKNAPFTNAVNILDGMIHQKFMNGVTMLFDDKRLSSDNDLIKSDYYDGTYESLLKYMKEHEWTCLFISDMDLLYKLIKDGVSIVGKTIFVSKIGYNYDRTEKGTPYVRYCEELFDTLEHFDLVTFDLFDFGSIIKETENGQQQ